MLHKTSDGTLCNKIKGPVHVSSFLPQDQYDPDLHYDFYVLVEFLAPDKIRAYIPLPEFQKNYTSC